MRGALHVRRCSQFVLVGSLLSLIALPVWAQHTSGTEATPPEQLWTQYQHSPTTPAGKTAGRRALRSWAGGANADRLTNIAQTLPPGGEIWPTLVDALRTSYRTSKRPLSYRAGYGSLLQTLHDRIIDPRGWLHVMIALGDYQRLVEENRWAALRAYEEAYRTGGSRRLIETVEERLRALRPREIGRPAPTFEVTTLGDSTIALSSLRGDPVLLYFWARWCSPCLRKVPTLNGIESRYVPSNLHLLGLITAVQNRRKLSNYVQSENIDWPQAITVDSKTDTRSPKRLYGVEGPGPPYALGHLVLVDRQGDIAAQGQDVKAIRDTLQQILEP